MTIIPYLIPLIVCISENETDALGCNVLGEPKGSRPKCINMLTQNDPTNASNHRNPTGNTAFKQNGTTLKEMEVNANSHKWSSLGGQISGNFEQHPVLFMLCFLRECDL
jgi:hypothetical protein